MVLDTGAHERWTEFIFEVTVVDSISEGFSD